MEETIFKASTRLSYRRQESRITIPTNRETPGEDNEEAGSDNIRVAFSSLKNNKSPGMDRAISLQKCSRMEGITYCTFTSTDR